MSLVYRRTNSLQFISKLNQLEIPPPAVRRLRPIWWES